MRSILALLIVTSLIGSGSISEAAPQSPRADSVVALPIRSGGSKQVLRISGGKVEKLDVAEAKPKSGSSLTSTHANATHSETHAERSIPSVDLPSDSKSKYLLASLKPPSSSVINTDYRTRSASTPLPEVIHGSGLNGVNLPIGREDKYRDCLPTSYAPTDLQKIPKEYSFCGQPTYLRKEAAESLTRMFNDAARRGLCIQVFSGYRDYNHQKRLYMEAVSHNRHQSSVAKPGHSEHALGTTADVTTPDRRNLMSRKFLSTPEGRWLSANVRRYGWEMTVHDGDGNIEEPWHIRYNGGNRATTLFADAANKVETVVKAPFRAASSIGNSVTRLPGRLMVGKTSSQQ